MKTYRSIRVDVSIWSTEDPALIKKATVVKSHLQEILDSLTQEDIEKYAIKFSWNRD